VSETDGLVAEIASKAWNYVVTHRLWESKYSSLEAFKKSIAYEITVDDVLKRQEVLSLRKQAEARGILANWKSLPHDALPPELCPPMLSKNLLAFLNRLSKVCPLDKAITLLRAQVGLKEWTEPDVIFERNILLGPDDNQAFELAGNIRKQLVDTYKLLHPLMKVRERNAFGDNSSFAENDVAQSGDGDEDIELDEDSE
jgi:hypothetical protein